MWLSTVSPRHLGNREKTLTCFLRADAAAKVFLSLISLACQRTRAAFGSNRTPRGANGAARRVRCHSEASGLGGAGQLRTFLSRNSRLGRACAVTWLHKEEAILAKSLGAEVACFGFIHRAMTPKLNLLSGCFTRLIHKVQRMGVGNLSQRVWPNTTSNSCE